MPNDWGVFKEATTPVLWVKTESPLELSSEDMAIDNLSFAEAIVISDYLNSAGDGSFAPGRPKDRQPH